MIYNRPKKNNRGIAFAEYVFLIGLFCGAIILINFYMQKGISAKVGQITDTFIGPGQTGEVSPYNVAGGKQLVSQSGLYGFSGVTNIESSNTISNKQLAVGARGLSIQGVEVTESPGKGMDKVDGMEFKLTPLEDYKFEDNEKVPNYVPDFIYAKDGYIDVPKRN